MAYGFGATYGVGASDSMVFDNTVSSPTSTMTILTRVFQHGAGGGNLGRWWETAGGTVVHHLRAQTVPDRLFLRIAFSAGGLFGDWSIPRPTLDTWHAHAVTYDGSSTANNPSWVVDGTSQTVTRVTAPSGTMQSGAATNWIGANNTGTRNWDGMVADFAWYNRILTANEIALYMAGYSALFIQDGLIAQHSLLDSSASDLNGTTTVTGSAIQPHPTVIFPSHDRTAMLMSLLAVA